jgi:hypothetical protein
MKNRNSKRWTGEEIGKILSNWDNSLSINKNVENISILLPDRTPDGIKRELYDFNKRGTLRMKQGKIYPC